MIIFPEPSHAPANVRLTATTTTSLEYAWDYIPCGSRGGSIYFNYNVDTSPPKMGATPNTAITLNGLDPCTPYRFTVRATTSAGDGSEGSATGSTDNGSKYLRKNGHGFQREGLALPFCEQLSK